MHSLEYSELVCIRPPSCINTCVHLDSNLGEQHQLQKHKFNSCSLYISRLSSPLVFSFVLVQLFYSFVTAICLLFQESTYQIYASSTIFKLPWHEGGSLLLICPIMLCSKFLERWVQVPPLSCIVLFSSMQLWLPLFPPIWLPIEICKYHIFYQLYLSCQRSNMLVYATWLQTIFDLLLVLFMLVRAGQNSKISTFSLLSAGTPLFAYSKEC